MQEMADGKQDDRLVTEYENLVLNRSHESFEFESLDVENVDYEAFKARDFMQRKERNL